MRKRFSFWLLFLILSPSIIFCVEKEKPLGKKAQAAIAKYDKLPEKFRKRAVDAWKAEFARTGDPLLFKNDPVYLPELVTTNERGDFLLKDDAFGVLGTNSDVNSFPGSHSVYVLQVISESRVIVNKDPNMFFVDGIDTSKIEAGRSNAIHGVFYADGTETFVTKAGTIKTIPLVRMVEIKDEKNGKKNEKKK